MRKISRILKLNFCFRSWPAPKPTSPPSACQPGMLVSVQSTLHCGYVPHGEAVQRELQVQNTAGGGVWLEMTPIQSSMFSVSAS